MNSLKTGWFSEINDLWPGISQSLQVEKVIFSGESEYQSILILQTKSHGKTLVLDGIIQCTEFDEFSYQEMISFLPLCSHSNPETILIVGGGDGGVAREVVKFPSVKKIVQIEIDEKVIEVSKKFLPFMSKELNNSKIEVIIGDGFEFIKKHISEFDVIITDSSDPVGPAACLFEETYFSLMKNALKKNGVICSQAGTIWTNLHILKKTVAHCKQIFSKVNYGIVSVPTYPTGQIGFILGSMNLVTNFTKPTKKFTEEELDQMDLKYYSAEIHEACFVLPRFASKKIQF